MSAIRRKADMPFALRMSAFDPKRTRGSSVDCWRCPLLAKSGHTTLFNPSEILASWDVA